MTRRMAVYADWIGLNGPLKLGWLHALRGAGRELFEFEFDTAALTHRALRNLRLDPQIGPFEGRQHPAPGHAQFGAFADASPDRWGRLLMRRRHEREQRAGEAAPSRRLHESDYLLGVHDLYRLGALRLRLDDAGDFLDNRHDEAAPPFVKLRELEAASLALERDSDNSAEAAAKWLRLLIAPGGSLGGARPKASVMDPEGNLWIAKFPSLNDEHDVGGWELVVQTLAQACGLNVPPSFARRFGNRAASGHHSFLVQRFDRQLMDGGASGASRTASLSRTSSPWLGRWHVASAMTLTGHRDGDDASSGASYLELARVLMEHGARPKQDLEELWSRIVFNMLVSNADDHLRNHAYLLAPGRGWQLAPAYDMNPQPDATGLSLNVSEADNALSLELAFSVAPYFRVSRARAQEIVAQQRAVVRQWAKPATALKIAPREQERMAQAFRLAA